MQAKDIRVGDIIDGKPVTSVEKFEYFGIRSIAEVVILTMEDGRKVSHLGDAGVPATRPVPDAVMPKDAVMLTVIANGVKILVREVFPSDGRSFILVGQGISGRNHWERVYDHEFLKVVG